MISSRSFTIFIYFIYSDISASRYLHMLRIFRYKILHSHTKTTDVYKKTTLQRIKLRYAHYLRASHLEKVHGVYIYILKFLHKIG